MKRLFSLFAFLSVFATAHAGPADTVTIHVPYTTAAYVVAVMDDPMAVINVAGAMGKPGVDTASIAVVVTEGTLLQILRATRQVSYGVATHISQNLVSILAPVIASRPWLAAQVAAANAEYATTFGAVVESGKAKIEAVKSGLKQN